MLVIIGGSNIGDGNSTGSLILIGHAAEEGIMKRRRTRQTVFDYDFQKCLKRAGFVDWFIIHSLITELSHRMKESSELKAQKDSQSTCTTTSREQHLKIVKYRKMFLTRSQFKMRNCGEIKEQERSPQEYPVSAPFSPQPISVLDYLDFSACES